MDPGRTTWRVERSEDGAPLLGVLADRLRLSRKAAKRLLDARVVFVNHRRVWMARHVVRVGDRVEVLPPAGARPPDHIRLLFEDDQVVVADKPAGLFSNGPDSLEERLREQMESPFLAAVHRLDRDTTGCLLLARNREAAARLVEAFRQHRVRKTYHAIVLGRVTQPEQEIRSPVGGLAAITRIRLLSSTGDASHVSASLETGRTHQIRKHLAGIGHPVLGDKVYATRAVEKAELRAAPRQMLHAATTAFPHPVTGRPVAVKSPLPGDFRMWLKKLKLS